MSRAAPASAIQVPSRAPPSPVPVPTDAASARLASMPPAKPAQVLPGLTRGINFAPPIARLAK